MSRERDGTQIVGSGAGQGALTVRRALWTRLRRTCLAFETGPAVGRAGVTGVTSAVQHSERVECEDG